MFSAKKLWIYSIVSRDPAIVIGFPVAGTVLGPEGVVAQAQIRKIMKIPIPITPKAINS